METASASRIRSCHVLTALGTFVTALTCMYWIGVGGENRISAIVGLGFGQISLVAIWFIVGASRDKIWISAVSLLGCYLTMAIWASVLGHVRTDFFFSLAIFCIVYFFAMAAVMLTLRRLRGVTIVRLHDTQVSDGNAESFSGQYGIRDIMIIMSVAALFTASIKFFGSQGLPKMLIIFGLISASFFLISWSVVATCLSQRWRALAVLSAVLVASVFFSQYPIFTSILGPGGDAGFFFFLDISLVLAVAQHALIARGFGYRLKVIPNRK